MRTAIKILASMALLGAGIVLAAAIGSMQTAAPSVAPSAVVASTSCYGVWVTVHDDARTAQSAGNLLKPVAVADSVCHWIKIERPAARMGRLRCKVPIATTAVGTSPVVRVFAGYGTLNTDGSAPTDGSFRVERLDSGTWTAAGLTLAFPASPTTSNCPNDATYFYATAVLQTPVDMQGAQYILVEVETAGACTSSAIMLVEAVFLN